MKKTTCIVVTIISLIHISQAKADDSCYGKEHWSGSCGSPVLATNGNTASCGEGCTYTYSNGTITITADNEHYENPQIDSHFFSRAYRENNQFTDENGNTLVVNNVLIDGIIKFNGDAFNNVTGSPFNISGKDGTLILDDMDWNAFVATRLTGNIIWRGSSDGGLNNGVRIDCNLIIEDTATVSRSFCKTDMEKCLNLLASAGANDDVLNAAQAYPDGCSSLTLSGDCAKCKGENFKLSDGICYRIRYTPAEAAEVAGETNTIFLYYK